jgi:outer membrane protein assembly factor BamE (lipoprotein component of BamABCDE complex)
MEWGETMMTHIRLIIALSLLAMLFGCSNLTMENYSKIKMGNEYSEVVKILGKPDNCSEALFVKNCVWGNEQKNITVNFAGDKVLLFTRKNIK